jgi:hypothetical protein
MTGFDRGRAVKLLGMLGSAHDGEIASAGRAVEKLRRAAKVTWADILAPRGDRLLELRIATLEAENRRLKNANEKLRAEAAAHDDRRRVGELLQENDKLYDRIRRLEAANEQLQTRAVPQQLPENLAELLSRAIAWERHLSDWERGFIHDLVKRQRRRLTPRQAGTLADIDAKIALFRRHHGVAQP